MTLRFRPHVPIAVRVAVALRQVRECTLPPLRIGTADSAYLKVLLYVLFDNRPAHLHHRPALVNRPWNKRRGDYDPPANDPDHLFYLEVDEHGIETRVRGIGAQRSDLGQARYLKKAAKNRERRAGSFTTRKASVLQKRPSRRKSFAQKRRWPSRPFPKRRKR
jgi:hypothetical protein